MIDKKQVARIINLLLKTYPNIANPEVSLRKGTPYEVLICTILSAQTTDLAVEKVSNPLFGRYPTPHALSQAEIKDVEKIIHSLGFFHVKAKNIVTTAKELTNRFEGKVPHTMEDLLSLPGVGRKTANIVLYHAFGKKEGIAVDTHVRRLSSRIGFSDTTNQERVERRLMELVPKKWWGLITDLFIAHGRACCTGRNPQCGNCPINSNCRYYNNSLPGRTNLRDSIE